MSLVRGALQPGLSVVKKTAPFYSAVDDALAAIKRPKGTGAEFYTELTKQPGVKKAELADRKLEQAFKAKGKMTKEEAQQVLKENPPPNLKEKVLDDSQMLEEDELKEIISQEMYGKPYDEVYNQGDRSRVFNEAMRRLDTQNGTIYGDYKTPGGENYREILLKLPDEKQRWWAKNGQGIERIFSDADEASRFAGSRGDARAMDSETIDRMRNQYQSSHWKDDPNVLAHMRVQDRKGPNGEKILHVEEIQSDWHQQGRKAGYKNEESIKKAQRAFDEYNKDAKERLRQIMLKEAEGEMKPENAVKYVNGMVNTMDPSGIAGMLNEKSTFNELYRTARDADKIGVPDAPFKKNWHELAMKRLLNYAADNGYDSIAITPGAEQASRYSLSKQLSEVMYDPSTGYLLGRDHNGKLVVAQQGITTEKLPDYIGKEGAQKILETPVDDAGIHALKGADLSFGGEGMKGFYDQILPSYLNTFGKPYNTQMGQISIPGDRGATVERLGVAGRNLSEMTPQEVIDFNKMVDEAGAIKLHSFPITPEMRESIKQKGLPLYQQIGIPTAGAGAASQMPQQMQEPELEPEVKKADGGAINYNTAPDMSDGGRIIQGAPFKRGGKVKVTTNPDAMFMELSNKKLKRK
jgi:hypothetical protein